MKNISDDILQHLRKVVELPDLSNTKYRCIDRIAAGGMGTVFLAEDTQLRRNVALKVLNIPDADPALAERMMREARVLAGLEHPCIVPVHDAGTLPDGRVFYVMKLVKGKNLDELVRKQTPLLELLRIFQKICEAVAFAHSHCVIHRDLKPQNIMVSDFGEVLVLDWGLAKVLSASEKNPEEISGRFGAERKNNVIDTQTGTVMGTPAYMAPEQASGDWHAVDERADVYALGAILHFLLTGIAPRESNSDAAFRSRQKTPKLLETICKKALATHKEYRYENAADLSTDIERFLNGLSVSSYRENTFEKIGRWMDSNKFVVSLILVYIVVRFLIYFFARP